MAWWTLGTCGCKVSIANGKPQIFSPCNGKHTTIEPTESKPKAVT